MTTHRLRHTYATTLLNAGMSLMGVMKLLGHRDYRMTLRYTETTLETVGKEYRTALTQLESRYRIALTTAGPTKLDPDEALGDIIRWVQKRAGQSTAQRMRAQALVSDCEEFGLKSVNSENQTQPEVPWLYWPVVRIMLCVTPMDMRAPFDGLALAGEASRGTSEPATRRRNLQQPRALRLNGRIEYPGQHNAGKPHVRFERGRAFQLTVSI